MHKVLTAVVFGLTALAAGCGGREYGWEKDAAKEKPAATPPAAVAELEAKAKASWAKRDEEPALRDTIATLKKLIDARAAEDYATLVWLARAHYLLGEVATEPEKKLEAYEAGMTYGDRALNAIPAFRERFAKSQAVEDAVEAVGKDGIEAIYWDAVNISKWSKARGMTKALFLKDKVKKMVERVAALDDRWWYGAADRYLGSYWAALPTIAGRDLKKSREHYDKTKAIEPRYFATRTLMAEYYARGMNDRKIYKAELEYVLRTPADILPEVAPEQRVEQRKAKRLLDEIDDYFDEEEPAPAAAPAAPAGAGGAGGGK